VPWRRADQIPRVSTAAFKSSAASSEGRIFEMSWLERLGEPLAPTPEEAAHFMQTELKAALPKGWELHCVQGDPLAWTLDKTDIRPGEWPMKAYGVRISRDLELIVFTYGNKDIGAFNMNQVLLQSLVIDASALRHFGMATCLEYLMTRAEPNEYGYT